MYIRCCFSRVYMMKYDVDRIQAMTLFETNFYLLITKWCIMVEAFCLIISAVKRQEILFGCR